MYLYKIYVINVCSFYYTDFLRMGIFNERKEKIILDYIIRISVIFSYKTTSFYHPRYMFQLVIVLLHFGSVCFEYQQGYHVS